MTCLTRVGLDPNDKTLKRYRRWFAQQDADAYVDKVMALANVDQISMVQLLVFDDLTRGSRRERDPLWAADPRFAAAARGIDPLLIDWPQAAAKLRAWGYDARPDFSGRTVTETQRFLGDWIDRMKAIYVAVSLPPESRSIRKMERERQPMQRFLHAIA